MLSDKKQPINIQKRRQQTHNPKSIDIEEEMS